MAKERKPNTCFFCGKTKPNMFSGIGDALICSDCIEAGHQLVLTLPKQRKAAGELDINSFVLAEGGLGKAVPTVV